MTQTKFQRLLALLNVELNKKTLVKINANGVYELRPSLELRRKAAVILEESVITNEDENLSKLTLIEFTTLLCSVFPEGVMVKDLPVRTNKLTVEKQLKEFSKKYKYERRLILFATKKYIESQHTQRYEYCKTLGNFIMAYGKSVLADLCEAYKSADLSIDVVPVNSFSPVEKKINVVDFNNQNEDLV